MSVRNTDCAEIFPDSPKAFQVNSVAASYVPSRPEYFLFILSPRSTKETALFLYPVANNPIKISFRGLNFSRPVC